MLAIFVFGTTDREKPRGLVVDRCPNCLDLRWFEILDHRRAWHLYFVPLGKGRFLFTSQRCAECGAQFPVESDDFVAVLPLEAKTELDLDEALRRTNPPLARRFAEIDSLLGDDKPPYRDATDESGRKTLHEAVERLRELERRGVDSSRWVTRLRDWPRLSSSERELIAAELKGFHDAATR